MEKKNPFFRLFCSLKLTITLLIALAGVSIFGTVIPQRMSERDYLKHYSTGVFHFMKLLGLFDLYHAWWFQFLLLLLIVNLIFCSLDRFPKAWKFIAEPKKWLGPDEVKRYPLRDFFKVSVKKMSPDRIEEGVRTVLKSVEETRRDGISVFFAQKGQISRLGVYITHLSVIIILLGALLGSLFGFEAFVSLMEGSSTDTVYLMDGKNTPKKLDFTVRCDKFSISLYPNGMVKAYTSTLSILKHGKVVINHRKVRVNHPLMYEGIRFYQASYQRQRSPLLTLWVMERGKKGESVFKILGGIEKMLPDGTVFSIVQYNPDLQGYGPAVQIMERNPQGSSRNFWIFLNYPEYDLKRNGRYVFVLKNIQALYSTGLQITKDPGVWVVWLGCLMMVGGLIVTFFISHKRIWVIPNPAGKETEITIVGSTNRNLIAFEKEFQKITDGIRKELGKKPRPLSQV